MKLVIVAVRDAAVGTFHAPMFFRSRGEAIRSFTDAVNDPKASFGKHAADYDLFDLGDFDDETGLFHLDAAAPLRIARASDVIMTAQ